MDKKSTNDPLSKSFSQKANLRDQDEIRVLAAKIKTEEGRRRFDRRILAAERLHNYRRRTEITATMKDRHKTLMDVQMKQRTPAPTLVPSEVRGFHGRAIPLTDSDRQHMKWKADAGVKNQNVAIDKKVTAELAAQIVKRGRQIVAEERQAEKAHSASRSARRDFSRSTTRGIARASFNRDRGIGD